MKTIYTICLLLCLVQASTAQKIVKVSIQNDGHFDRVSFDLGESVLLHVSKDGQIVKWGVDVYTGRDDNYMDRLDEYTGKTGYFAATDDSAFRGKIRFIGRTYFTYYASYENELLKGKLKSIGNINIDYYLPYENEAFRGLLKNVGQQLFTWYSSFDNEGLRGKLKSIGNTSLNYYSSFDDRLIRGRIKSIDRASFTYYSSFDKPEYRGSLKTGSQTTIVNGIKFFIRW
jgi:hypothetical protein